MSPKPKTRTTVKHAAHSSSDTTAACQNCGKQTIASDANDAWHIARKASTFQERCAASMHTSSG